LVTRTTKQLSNGFSYCSALIYIATHPQGVLKWVPKKNTIGGKFMADSFSLFQWVVIVGMGVVIFFLFYISILIAGFLKKFPLYYQNVQSGLAGVNGSVQNYGNKLEKVSEQIDEIGRMLDNLVDIKEELKDIYVWLNVRFHKPRKD
jgi:hypothetical protein